MGVNIILLFKLIFFIQKRLKRRKTFERGCLKTKLHVWDLGV